MIQPCIDLIDFEPLDWAGWKQRYKGVLRVGHQMDKVAAAKCGLLLATAETEIFIPWYEKGKNWMDGEKPRQVSIGDRMMLVRVPALRIGERYILLDGLHRMTDLKPALVLIDWAELPPSDYVYFVDLFNPFIKGKK